MKTLLHIKIFLLIACCTLLGVHSMQAQHGEKKEKIEALRISFITQRLDLTSNEAQVFWPVYNEYSDKLEATRKTFKQQYNKQTDYDFKTDKEAEAYINAEVAMKQKESDYFKEYYEKFKKVLPIKKVAKLRRAEEDFKKELLKQIQGKGVE